MSKRKVILYISMSLDGFIAGNDDDLSFLSAMEKEGEDYGYADFTASVDTYIVGRKTYEVVLNLVGSFPQAKQYDCYVLTQQTLPGQDGITFYNGDIAALIQGLRQKEGKNIYCDGGGEVVHLFMENDLIDEYIVSIIPTILGEGKCLFLGKTHPRTVKLASVKEYETGLVQLRYIRDRVGA